MSARLAGSSSVLREGVRCALSKPQVLCASLACGAAIALFGSVARADDAADARAEYAAGTASLQKKAYREAAEHFEVAARLRPHAAANFAAAKAWQLAGELVRSADRFAAAIERGELNPKETMEATRKLAQLEEKLGTIQISGDAALEVQIDDGASAHPPAKRHAAPGPHVLRIRGNGKNKTQDITLTAGGSLPVDLRASMLDDQPAGPRVEPTPEPPPPPPGEARSGGSTMRVLGIVALSTAAVGFGVSGGLWAAANGAKTDFFASGQGTDAYNKAKGLETGTNVALISSIVVGATGAALVTISLFQKPHAPAPSTSVRVGPAGARFVGSF